MRQLGMVAILVLCTCAASFGAVSVIGSAAPYSLVYSDPADLGTQIDQSGLAEVTESFGIDKATFQALSPQVIPLDGGPVWNGGSSAQPLGSVVAKYSAASTVTFAFPAPGTYSPTFAAGLGYNHGGANTGGRSAFSGANTSDHLSVIVSLADAGASYNYNCFDARITTTGGKGVGAVGFCVSTRSLISCSACDVTFTLSDGTTGTVALPDWSGSTSHQKFFIGYQAPAGKTITRIQIPDIEGASGSTDNMTLGIDDLSILMVDDGSVEPLIGDINRDGVVNVSDLQALVAAWASHATDKPTAGTPASTNWNADADLNADGFVNVGDLQLLVAHWGSSTTEVQSIVALKRDSGLTAGGAIDARFDSATVRAVTVSDAGISGPGEWYWYNFGAASVGGLNNLFKFDLSSIPAGSTINLAQLRLYHTVGNGGLGGGDVSMILTHDWLEGTQTGGYPGAAGGVSAAHPIGYNTSAHQNASGGTMPPTQSWGPNSDSFFSLTADAGSPIAPSSGPAGVGYHVFNVTSHVQQWVSGTKPNYGWANYSGYFDFHCSEAGTAYQPVLFVDYTTGGGADTTAPAAVSNLAAGSPTDTSLTLSWTAPGDDGSTGTAASYDIRYSSSTINDANWASATQVTGEPAPAVAGTNQNMVVNGLSANTTYYFAMKTSDEVPNTSTLSNVASGTTTASTDTTAPAAVANLAAGSPTGSTLTLTWTAPGDDGSTGTAASYDIRYRTDGAVTESNWSSATQVTGEPAPAVAGTNQSMIVTGLSGSTTYYFAIKTSDEVPNTSAISNSPSGTTSAPSTIVAFKRHAGLTGGGAIDSRFNGATVQTVTVADVGLGPFGLSRWYNYGATTSGGYAILYKFDLSSIPSDSTINLAQLRIYHTAGNGSSGIGDVARVVTHNWLEGNRTGTSPGAAGGASYAHPMGYNTDAGQNASGGMTPPLMSWGPNADTWFSFAEETGDVGLIVSPSSAPVGLGYHVIPVTMHVQQWVNGVCPNYGFAQAGGNWDFHCSEAGTALEPVLFVDYTPGGGSDATAPAAVTNLATSSPTATTITLTWTAPGDDGSTGTATSYDIRYRIGGPMDTSNWGYATKVTGEPAPAAAGTNQSMTVTGLTPGITYYFAMKTTDEAYLTAGLSNSPWGTTTAEADITAPAAITNLATSNPSLGTVTLTWTAPGDDNGIGTATCYDIRYRTDGTVNDSNWASATQLAWEPAPVLAGTSQNITVSGLTPDTTYYFAIKTTDNLANTSAISNSPSATTLVGTSKTLLTPKDFKYLGYYALQPNGSLGGIEWTRALTHRYVGGQLRFLTMPIIDSTHRLIEFAKPANFGDTVTMRTNYWPNIFQGTGWSMPPGFSHIGLWYESSQNRLWSTWGFDYPDSDYWANTTLSIIIRTLNDDGTVSNVKGPYGLEGIQQRRIYGGAQALPAWFQTAYSTGPYACGWGGYSSRAPVGPVSLGPTFYTIPELTGYPNESSVPTSAYKTLMDHSGATLGQDWYASFWPTSYDRGVRDSDVQNEFDGGYWKSPAPDGLGRWSWDSNQATGCWVETAGKQGFVTVPYFSSGRAWYESSAGHVERYTSEIQVFDPHVLGQAAQGSRAPWNTYPTHRRSVTDECRPLGLMQGDGAGKPMAATYDSTGQRLYVLAPFGANNYSYILVYEVGNNNAPVSDVAHTELSTVGTITGKRANTETKDGVYESIQESLLGNTSQLDHKWIFNVTGGASVTFNVKAYHTSNSEGDDFVFAYSTNGTTWTNMVTVSRTTDDGNFQTYTMPAGTSGTVYVRVQDADRTAGRNNLDSIFIDRMYFLSNP